jgi:hypothetical protein
MCIHMQLCFSNGCNVHNHSSHCVPNERCISKKRHGL